MPAFIGIQEPALLVILVLLISGAKRLPEIGRSLGQGLHEFKNRVAGKERETTLTDVGRRGRLSRARRPERELGEAL